MPARRALDLLAAAAAAAAAAAVVARLPRIVGETLGEPVPRFGAAVWIAVAAPAVVVVLAGRERPAAVRRALTLAAWAAALTLAVYGLIDLDVPRRRGVVLAVGAAAAVTGLRAVLAPARKPGLALTALAVGAATIAGVAAADRAPLRKSLPPIADTAAPPRAPNVLLVTLDTTRADALGCYGQERPVTPHIDAFASGAAVFTRATAEAPHTHPSIATLVTSRYPIEHGSVSRSPRLAFDVTTLAEHLRAEGYATAGFLDNPWLGLEFGLARGYERVDRRVALDRVASWVEDVEDTPFLLHVHLFHPHGPYELRADELARIGGSDAPASAREQVGDRIDARAIRAGEVPGRHGFDADELVWVRDLYLSEVRAMDATVGALLDLVDASNTIVAIAADHGEEFDERGSLHHSHTLFEELVHVPLLVRAPGRSGVRIDAPVGLVDVAPTLLDLAELPPLPHAAGRSLRPLLEGGTLDGRLVVTQRHAHAGRRRLTAARHGDWKLHLRTPAGAASLVPDGAPLDVALFDLAEDPGEQNDLAAGEPEVVERLLEELRRWEAAAEARIRASVDAYAARGGAADSESDSISPAARSELKGLGYGDGR